MKRNNFVVLVLACLFLTVRVALAQDGDKGEGSSKTTGIRAEFLSQLSDVEKKVVDLAEAMPAELYSWRPMEGVRSVSEVYVHIGGANYLFPSFIGVKRPEGMDQNMEKTVTEKPQVLDFLKRSFDHFRQAILKTSDTDLDKPAKMFGSETTVRNVLLTAELHLHEHLGQSIAYARMNKIVPPWTAAEQARQQEKSKK